MALNVIEICIKCFIENILVVADLGYGDVPFFRGSFSLKSADLWVSVFEISVEL